MSTVAAGETRLIDAKPRIAAFATALEVSLVYAGILYYVWLWRFTHPRLWMLILGIILVSQLARRDSLGALGLAPSQLWASAQIVLPLAAVAYVPLLVYGLVRHSLILIAPGMETLTLLVRYGTWCLIQEFLTQSYFHNRLMTVIQNPHRRSLVIALMFGAAHIPNPVLMVVTTIGGFCLAEIFARHRNIWPLALAHAVGGLLLAALLPKPLLHNMRVGPGYFFYGLR